MYGGGGGYSGGSFFDFLFGGSRASAAQPVYRPRQPVGPRVGNNGRTLVR